MAKLSKERVFMLRGWTVKIDGGKYFIAPSIAFQDKRDWHGPFKSLVTATTAIAKKLQQEFSERNARLP